MSVDNALYMRASQLLDAGRAALGTSCPDRSYVTIGPHPWDRTTDENGKCAGQLTVTMPQIAMTRDQKNPCFVALRPTFSLCLFRCVTALDRDDVIPKAPLLDAEADRLYTDAGLLLDEVMKRWDDRTLFPGAGCNAITFGTLRPKGPDGTLAGWEWDITLDPL